MTETNEDLLREALTDVLDALGALSNPHELHGWGIGEARAAEIARLATHPARGTPDPRGSIPDPRRLLVHSVAGTIAGCRDRMVDSHMPSADAEGIVEDLTHDVSACVRTVVDEECEATERYRALGLTILRRLGVSPVGPTLGEEH